MLDNDFMHMLSAYTLTDIEREIRVFDDIYDRQHEPSPRQFAWRAALDVRRFQITEAVLTGMDYNRGTV